PLSPECSHMLEQVVPRQGDVIDVDQAWTACVVDSAAQQGLPILYRATKEIVAVKVQQIEGEISKVLRPAVGDGVLQVADMGKHLDRRAGRFRHRGRGCGQAGATL